MITKSLTYASVWLLLLRNVQADHLNGCEWITSDHLKCESFNAVNDSETLQYSYQNCNQYGKILEIVNSNVYNLYVITLPPRFCNFTKISVLNSNVEKIWHNAFIMSQNVSELDLSFNNINDLEFMNRPFDHLEILNISHNKLESIYFDIKRNKPKLRELILDHNRITRVSKFASLFYRLQIIDLSYNKIDYLSTNYFGYSGNPEILKLHGNPVVYLEYEKTSIIKHFSITNVPELSNNVLEKLAETEILQVVDGKIGRIESSAFLACRDLKRLYLDNTTVNELGYQTFRDSTLKYVGPSNQFYENEDAVVFNFSGMSIQRILENVFQMISAPKPYLVLMLDKNQFSKIVSKTFSNLNLYSLSIRTSGIVELEPRSFTELKFSSCGQLDLSKNRIKKLRADVFHNLIDVDAINLASNSIKDIEIGAFNNIIMSCEGKLILSNNKITSLSPQLFKNITLLRRLYLNGNLLQTIDGIWFEGLLSLELLDLNTNLIVKVNKDNFVHTPNLATLKIASNRIETLTEDLGLDSLKRLDLQNNPFKNLEIEKLNVSYAIYVQVSELSKRSFKALKNLIVVDSCIETIQPLAFSETSTLRNLYLVNSTLKSLSDGAFKNSRLNYFGPKLEYETYSMYNLSNLALNKIGSEAFKNINVEQTRIILDNNSISVIRSATFCNINTLDSISIKNSKLVKLEEISFYNLLFDQNMYDTKIDLKNNNIRKLKTNTFRDINYLSNIDLSENEIEEIETGVFINITTYTFSLNLNNNRIRTLPSKMFVGNKIDNFKYLDLSNNQIIRLDGSEFKNIRALEEINLSNNKLEHFDSEILENFEQVDSIYVDNNPMIKSTHIKKLLKTNRVTCELNDGYRYICRN